MNAPIRIIVRLRVLLGVALALGLIGCTPPAEKARQALLKQGINVDASSVMAAAASGQTDVLQLLQMAGQDLNQPPAGQASTPLIVAIQKKSAALPLLLETATTASINAPDEAGRTALSHALSAAEEPLVLSLLAKFADPTATTHPAGTVLDDAIKQGRKAVVSALLAHLPDGAPMLHSGLLAAVQEADADVSAQLLAKAASPDTQDDQGHYLLELAAAAGDLGNAALLVKAGAKLEPAKLSGNPLSHAVKRNSLELARLLLTAGCTPDSRDVDGGTATGLAATLQRLPLLELFLDHQAAAQPHFQSALVVKDLPLLELLRKHGADLNTLDAEQNPPLIQTVLRKDVEMTRWLLANGADPARLGQVGQPAFVLAQILRNLPLLQALLEAGADANQAIPTPITKGFLAMVDNEHFKTWLQKDEHLTPMMLAASRGDLEVIRLLMKFGGKRGNQTKGWQRYPVNFACDSGNIPAARLLLGQDPDGPRDVRIVVSLSKQRAWIYKGSEILRSADISTGKSGFTTPPGKYVISDKQADWKSSIYKVPMPFFMRLSCKDFGLHAGVVSGGGHASHGCVRLPKDQAAAFYGVMQIGDPVTILE